MPHAARLTLLTVLVLGVICALFWDEVSAIFLSSEDDGSGLRADELLLDSEKDGHGKGPALSAAGQARRARQEADAGVAAAEAAERPPPKPVEAFFRGRVRNVDGEAAAAWR